MAESHTWRCPINDPPEEGQKVILRYGPDAASPGRAEGPMTWRPNICTELFDRWIPYPAEREEWAIVPDDHPETAMEARKRAFDAEKSLIEVGEVLERIACLGNGDAPGNSDGNRMALDALRDLYGQVWRDGQWVNADREPEPHPETLRDLTERYFEQGDLDVEQWLDLVRAAVQVGLRAAADVLGTDIRIGEIHGSSTARLSALRIAKATIQVLSVERIVREEVVPS